MSYFRLLVSSDQSGHSYLNFVTNQVFQSAHQSGRSFKLLLLLFFQLLCVVNTRHCCVGEIPGDLEFLKYLNLSIWYQQPRPPLKSQSSHFFPILMFDINLNFDADDFYPSAAPHNWLVR